ncbi:zinc finger protein 33B-like [Ochlerotatus camptorhynchus]|uniref:zinc finger protein 33B-like n=1 Tax=Ochlerotatus camptorhynchus TaxID=644619 RepID=UPI0031DA1E99
MSTEKLCRLCMGRSNLIHSVLDDNLLQKIAICVSIMINPADKLLPLELCALCALKVKDFFEFRQNCLKVQQLLEQDACSINVQSVSQPSPIATVKQEKSSTKPEEHLQIAKFEVIIDEDERLSEIQDAEESLEEPDQMIEQLEDIADENDLVEDLVEQDEVLSETEQTIESENVPESDIQTTDARDIDYEIQMIELNFDQNPSETLMDEDEEEEYNDEQFIEDVEENDEVHIQETLPTKSVSKTSLNSCTVRKKKHPHDPKPERDEKEIYKSLLQKCANCGKSVERNRMEGHLNRHLDVRPYICTEGNCGMAFHCKISLRLHTKNRHGTEELHCDLCDKVYFSKKALYHHKKESHADKHFACDECGLVFVSNARLNRHKVTHTDQREFKCPHCPKEFYRSNNLKVHIRSHTKEKPFSCSSCDKAFGYQRLLREHMNRHHKGNFVL